MATSNPSYAIRMTAEDKICLRELSQQLQRSQAGTIRLLLRESLKALQASPTNPQTAQQPEQVT